MQTRSADEPMTTFVLCNECGNRWKVCMSVSFFLPCHPQELPHLRSSRPTAPNGGWRGAVLPACTEQVCRAGDSGALLGRQGQRTRVCACFRFGKHPARVGTVAGILSQDGQVCHLNTDGISLLRSQGLRGAGGVGRKNNSLLHLDHTSLQSASTDAISFEPSHSQGGGDD